MRRWGQQLEGSKTTDRPAADELHRRLDRAGARRRRRRWVGIVHGDYRLDNLLTGDDDHIKAVVDWEMATLGDVRTDLALLLVYDRLAVAAVGRAWSPTSAKAPGYPTGRAAPGDVRRRPRPRPRRHGSEMGWHLGLAYFKLAVILEGIHFRFLQGATVGEGFDQIGAGFDPLIAAGLDALGDGRKRTDMDFAHDARTQQLHRARWRAS